MITNILSKKYYTVLCGNIGYSVCKALVEHEEAEIFVVELSSFQLENSIIDPDISVILNISPCHLDHHKTFKNYYESKKNISLNQSDNQIVIYNFEDSYCSKIVNDSLAKKVSFSTESVLTNCYVYHNCIYFKKRKILKLNNCIQSKQFLLKDYMAAISTVMQISKISPKIIKNVINKFEGVKYRLSPIYENIYNDAKSTNPFSTIAALEGLDNVFLICGGYDRYENLGVLNEYLYKIKKVFVYGATAEKVYNYMTLNNVSCYKFDNLIDATKEALFNRSNEVILYSPMFASYDQFSSYIERGELFEKIIKDYKK